MIEHVPPSEVDVIKPVLEFTVHTSGELLVYVIGSEDVVVAVDDWVELILI